MRLTEIRLLDHFLIRSGDFHSTAELDPGETPLISCGDTNNGLVGFFDIPEELTYRDAITVAYNGSWPLLTKFHPYRFGAKDDVGVLVPRYPMTQSTMFFVAAMLNRQTWRHSWGRKCYREKLEGVMIPAPVVRGTSGEQRLDEATVTRHVPKSWVDYVPPRNSPTGRRRMKALTWTAKPVTSVFRIARGDFHSLGDLASGEVATVSRVAGDNGVVGYYTPPEEATIYPPGLITISTVGGDAFVQLQEFAATDNVLVCSPLKPLRISTLFFLAFALNEQKWRYSYGRQCYLEKFRQVSLYVPVSPGGAIDEDAVQSIVETAPYWNHVRNVLGQRRSHFLA